MYTDIKKIIESSNMQSGRKNPEFEIIISD
jgi:hypothetical protein